MKKFYYLLLIISLIFINCATNKNNSENEKSYSGKKIDKSFGSFMLPDDWIEVSETPSAKGFYYYFHKSQIFENMPTNIAITMTENSYDKNNTAELGREITNLLTIQTEGRAKINTQVAATKQGYPLLIYTIEDPQAIKTTNLQFYIVNDKKYVLVYLTDFHHVDVTDAQKVARNIVDSFVMSK